MTEAERKKKEREEKRKLRQKQIEEKRANKQKLGKNIVQTVTASYPLFIHFK